jgi:hypothetical protein
MRFGCLLFSLVIALSVAGSVHSKLGPLDPDERRKQLAESERLFRAQDVKGLLELLKASHLFIKTDAALRLGRLGAREALKDLREMDLRYSRLECAPSGEFGVAIILIENSEPEARKKALIAVATDTGTKTKRPTAVINAAGKELSRFPGDDVFGGP